MDVQKWDDIELKPVILVANKSDLVRSRAVSKQGKLIQEYTHHHSSSISFFHPVLNS